MSYDAWKTTAPESDDDVCGECSVCYGGEGEPCSEECAQIVFRAARVRMQRGWYEAARKALKLARRYRQEDGPGKRRERECVLQARVYRDSIRVARVLADEDFDTAITVALGEDLKEAAQ